MGNVGAGVVPVEVDRAALLAEAQSIAAESPDPIADAVTPEPGSASPGMPADPLARGEEIKPLARLLVTTAANNLAPAWKVTPEECNAVGDSLGVVLGYWMPATAIDPKYIALANLAGALWTVASKRRDENGKWRPLHEAAKPVNDQPTPAGAPVRGGIDAMRATQ